MNLCNPKGNIGRGETTLPLVGAATETTGDTGEPDGEDDELGEPAVFCPPMAEFKSPNGLGNPCSPGHSAGGTRP